MECATGGLVSETYFIKQHRKDNFTILDNTCIRDDRISWKAKGLHTYLMSLPEDWKICLSDLINRSTDGRDSVTSAIKELESFGYVQRDVKRTDKGCFKNFCYMVFENPTKIKTENSNHPFTENPKTDNPISVKPLTENPLLLTTNKLNTDKQRTELTNPESEKVSESVFLNIIKGLFGGEYPFDKNFESAVLKHLTDAGIAESNLEEYLKYVFERTKLGNVQKSFDGLFRKLALANSIIRDFRNSCFIKKTEEKQNSEQHIRYIDCPVCSTRFREYDFTCPTCGVSLREINDQTQADFVIKKKIYEMSDSEKESYEKALNEFTNQVKAKTGRPFLLENEKIQFWKEYGILN